MASMAQLWDSTVLPLLEAHSPKTVIEIGANQGSQTRLIAAWASEHRAVLHVVDPMPAFDTDAYEREWSGHLVVHRTVSLSALALIGSADMVLVDGDHNWYTVLNELGEIDRLNSDWPLVVIDDVGWPYGRRDMYYDPETVPAEHRHPFRKSALRRFRSDGGGLRRLRSALGREELSTGFFNATHEGGPHNGVLTAVEDFLSNTDRDLLLLAHPGNSGLAVILSDPALRQSPTLRRAVAGIHDVEYAIEISPVYAARELPGDAAPSAVRPSYGPLRVSRRTLARARRWARARS
jgi:hypothetical protein